MNQMARKVDAAAPVSEKRLVRRVLRHWLVQCGDKDFPCRTDIDPEALGEDWRSCFILDAKTDHPFPIFAYLGCELAKYSGVFLSGKSDWTMSLLDKVTSKMSALLETQEPVLVEDELIRFDGKQIFFRCVLLPLSDDGKTVTHVLGAANGKVTE